MNKFVRTGVGLLLPGEEVSKELPIQHIAPNSIKMTFPHFLELVKELEFLQRYYEEREGKNEKPVWTSYEVPTEDPDKSLTGFRPPLSGEIVWPPKEEDTK